MNKDGEQSIFPSGEENDVGGNTPPTLTAGTRTRLHAEILEQRFYSEDSMFGVFDVLDVDTGAVRTLVGKLPKLLPGENVEGEVDVQMRENPYTGDAELQWKVVSSMRPAPPASARAMEKFIGSGFAWRVGKDIASRLVKRYDKRTLDIFRNLEMDVDAHLESVGTKRLGEMTEEEILPALVSLSSGKRTKGLFQSLTVVGGIGGKTAASLLAGWISNRARHGVMLFLFDCGLSSALAGKVVDKLGMSALDIIDENPYALLDAIPSVPFSAVERMAKGRGLDANDPRRLRAILIHCVNSLSANAGHVCIPTEELLPKVYEFSLKTDWPADAELLRKELDSLRSLGILPSSMSGETTYVYPRGAFFAEKRAARAASRLTYGNGGTVSGTKVEHLVSLWEKESGIVLDESQREALFRSLSSRISIITGGPGTGKTTLLRCMKFVLENCGYSVNECAPTGKAARNMSKDASTVHRLLGLGRGNSTHGNPVESDWLFSDEASMEDIYLAAAKLDATAEGGANLVIIGDSDQLPSVGAGTVLSSLMESGKIPVSKLSLVHRTEKGGVLDFLEFMRRGGGTISEFGISRKPCNGLCYLGDGNGELGKNIVSVVSALASRGVPDSDIRVLVPMKKGEAGTVLLNRELQKLFNKRGLSGGTMETLSGGEKITWAVGDRVMNIENDYDNDVFNGETGVVRHVDPKSKSVVVEWTELEKKLVKYNVVEMNKLLHAWASTIHKSQGSEYGTVVVGMPGGAWHMAERALLYTAVSRAKRNCILMGDERTINKAIATEGVKKRHSLLSERMKGSVVDVAPDAHGAPSRDEDGTKSLSESDGEIEVFSGP